MEITFGISLEHLEAHLDIVEIPVILGAGVGVRPDCIAEVVQRSR